MDLNIEFPIQIAMRVNGLFCNNEKAQERLLSYSLDRNGSDFEDYFDSDYLIAVSAEILNKITTSTHGKVHGEEVSKLADWLGKGIDVISEAIQKYVDIALHSTKRRINCKDALFNFHLKPDHLAPVINPMKTKVLVTFSYNNGEVSRVKTTLNKASGAGIFSLVSGGCKIQKGESVDIRIENSETDEFLYSMRASFELIELFSNNPKGS